MNTDNKKGILERWFKVKKRGCCDIKIEEIKEERENTRKPESGKKDGEPGWKETEKILLRLIGG
jgi:hypothetical protein